MRSLCQGESLRGTAGPLVGEKLTEERAFHLLPSLPANKYQRSIRPWQMCSWGVGPPPSGPQSSRRKRKSQSAETRRPGGPPASPHPRPLNVDESGRPNAQGETGLLAHSPCQPPHSLFGRHPTITTRTQRPLPGPPTSTSSKTERWARRAQAEAEIPSRRLGGQPAAAEPG